MVEPGTGKEERFAALSKKAQALLALSANAPIIVVCSLAMRSTWERKAHECRPDVRACVLSGVDCFRAPVAGEMIILSYEALPERIAPLHRLTSVLFDEAYNRSQRARQAEALTVACIDAGGTAIKVGSDMFPPDTALADAHKRIAALPEDEKRGAIHQLSRSYSAPESCVRYFGCIVNDGNIVWPSGVAWPTQAEPLRTARTYWRHRYDAAEYLLIAAKATLRAEETNAEAHGWPESLTQIVQQKKGYVVKTETAVREARSICEALDITVNTHEALKWL